MKLSMTQKKLLCMRRLSIFFVWSKMCKHFQWSVVNNSSWKSIHACATMKNVLYFVKYAKNMSISFFLIRFINFNQIFWKWLAFLYEIQMYTQMLKNLMWRNYLNILNYWNYKKSITIKIHPLVLNSGILKNNQDEL